LEFLWRISVAMDVARSSMNDKTRLHFGLPFLLQSVFCHSVTVNVYSIQAVERGREIQNDHPLRDVGETGTCEPHL
jgi:hypothetical protein